jgi:hypothetical protein
VYIPNLLKIIIHTEIATKDNKQEKTFCAMIHVSLLPDSFQSCSAVLMRSLEEVAEAFTMNAATEDSLPPVFPLCVGWLTTKAVHLSLASQSSSSCFSSCFSFFLYDIGSDMSLS